MAVDPASLNLPIVGPQACGTNDTVVDTGDKEPLSDNSPVDSDSTGAVEFKEGGYGWVVVLSVFLVNAHTWGLNSAYAVFLAYYLRTGIIAGSSPMAFAFVGGLSISIALLISPLATLCIGRFGTNTTLRIGVVLEAASFIGASFATHIWHLLLSQGICFGFGLGFCFTATVGVVSQWFTKRRSFANALATGGSGFGGLIYALATNAMISNLGLAWAFRILAVICFVVNGASSLTMRDRNHAVGAVHVAFHLAFFKQIEFWFYLGWGFFAIISYCVVIFSLTDYAQLVGFSATQGSLVAAILNLSQGIGRPLIGFLSDRIGRINVAALSTLTAALSIFLIWILAGKHFPGLIVYSLFGMFAGSIWPCVAPVGAEVVGISLLPSALSIYWVALAFPATFAEVIALQLKTTGINGYIDVQIFAGVLFFVSFCSLWLLRSWKVQQLDALGLTNEEQEAATQNADATNSLSASHQKRSASTQGPGLVRAYVAGMLAMKRV
ncbi:major facilitator superfamily domain-containing protein [Bombardia bombarda]|uniref:Major facilitator superfamily domain-containing protein n=1 Tax=Bombardia bombarda TaxID=252184 RepID=A0AA39WNE3_9PEZI|nr:major facilitator superfamily domain-containing protein [Bombardia bombarda]